MATALVMMTDPGNPEANGRMVHFLKTAAALRAGDRDVALYFHGAGVNWATEFAERANPFTEHYGESFDSVKDLMAGGCDFCATVRFSQALAFKQLEIPIVGEEGHHHTVADLLMAGDTVVTF